MNGWLNEHPSAIVLIGILSFFAVWVLVCNLIAIMSGWRRLAVRWRAQQEFLGPKWSWQSAQMRFRANYNNCLTVGADQTGLFLQTAAIFRLGHPALFLPWSEITLERKRFFLFVVVELCLDRTEQIPFRIRPTLAAKLEAAAGRSWPAVPTHALNELS